MIKMEELKELWNIDPNFYVTDNDEENEVVVNGVIYPYEMTLSMEYDDSHCMRVLIDGEYYYFG